MNTDKANPHLTAKIVQSYVRHHRLVPDQLPELIGSVHRTIVQLGQPVQLEEVRTPAVSVRRSVHRDYVICLDCGYRGKTLRRHISTRHGLSRDEYLRRWGLRSDHRFTAPAYSERRSTLAKSLGLGRKSKAETTSALLPTAAPTPVNDQGSQATSIRRRRSRAASGSADVTSEAGTATPTRKRRSRSASKSLTAEGGHEAVPAKPTRKRRPRSRVASRPPEQTSSPTAET